MRIDKIQIKNYKGFADEVFTLNPHFTVFIGDNAKGKTTVLDALAVAAGGFLRGIDVAKHEVKIIKRNDIRVQTFEFEPKPQLPSIISAYGSVFGIENQTWDRKVIKLAPKLTTIGGKNIQKIVEEALVKSRLGETVVFPVIAYHGTGRLWNQNEPEKIPYEKQGEGVEIGYAHCLNMKSNSKDFLSWYKTYEDEVNKFNNSKDGFLLDAFKSAIISMIPNNQWVKMTYSYKSDDLIGLFTDSEGKHENLLFSQLSDGFRNVIGIVADIAFRCIKLNPHLGKEAVNQTPGIVLIDEIDLHLHPNWQRQIVKDLKECFPSIQFVVTTHSPFIVQSLESNELINLDKFTDVNLKDLTIGEVSEDVMGTDRRSQENESFEDLSTKYLETLKSIGGNQDQQSIIEELNKIEFEISDPGVRAFLKMKRLEKNV